MKGLKMVIAGGIFFLSGVLMILLGDLGDIIFNSLNTNSERFSNYFYIFIPFCLVGIVLIVIGLVKKD